MRFTFNKRKGLIQEFDGTDHNVIDFGNASLVNTVGQQAASLSRITDLSLIDDPAEEDGSVRYVIRNKAYFVLDKTSIEDVDGRTVVSTQTGNGRWLRLLQGHPTWLTQAKWYIDAVNGDDDNDGETETSALATASELFYRLGPKARIQPPVDEEVFARLWNLNILSSLPTDDPINLSLIMGQGVSVWIHGGVGTVHRTGIFTSVTQKVTQLGSNARTRVTDSSLPTPGFWSDYLGKRVRITSGPRAQSCFWVDKDLGNRQAAVSEGLQSVQIVLANPYDCLESGMTSANPANGDAYAVESLHEVTLGFIDISSEVLDTVDNYPPTLAIGELAINVRNECANWMSTYLLPPIPGVTLHTYSCRFSKIYSTCHEWFSENDCWSHDLNGIDGGKLVVTSGKVWKSGGLISAGTAEFCRISISSGCSLTLDQDAQVSKGWVEVAGQLRIGSLSIWDTPTGKHALYIGQQTVFDFEPPCPGAGVSLGQYNYDGRTVRLWGSGSMGAGVFIDAGCTMRVRTGTVPTLTGQMGDFILAGSTTARGWNETNSGSYTPLRNCTWSLFTSSIAAGFAFNAHNVNARASIVTV